MSRFFHSSIVTGDATYLYQLADIPLALDSALRSHQGLPAPLPRSHDLPVIVVDRVGFGSPEDLLALLHDIQMLDVLWRC